MEYKTIRLGDFADIIMGQSPKSEFYNSDGLGMPFLQGNRTFGRIFPHFDTYTTKPSKVANANDVIMSVRAPVGDLNIAPTDLCLGRGVCAIRAKNSSQSFLFYLMRHYAKELVNRESGTVFGSVNRNDIANLDMTIPESHEAQIQITSVLSALDSKIELNTRINKNLEEQAQALLTKCNDEADSSIKLGNLSGFVNGFAFKSSNYLTIGQYKIITIKNVQDGKVDSQNASCINDLPTKMSKDCILGIGDVLLSLTGNVGRVGIVCEQNLLLNQRVAKIVPLDFKHRAFLYFILRQPQLKTEMENISRGTAQQNLSPIEMLNLEIKFDNNIIEPLVGLLDSYFNQIIYNTIESAHLASIRDALLPKLMSGEIDVSKVDISAPSCLDKLSFSKE